MKYLVTFITMILVINTTSAQLLKKLKQKTDAAINKQIDKAVDGKETEPEKSTPGNSERSELSAHDKKQDLKVYSKFDFVPGTTILYYDNFEKDNIGET